MKDYIIQYSGGGGYTPTYAFHMFKSEGKKGRKKIKHCIWLLIVKIIISCKITI